MPLLVSGAQVCVYDVDQNEKAYDVRQIKSTEVVKSFIQVITR